MSAREFYVFSASMVASTGDESAVLVNFGIASLGLSIAEARSMSLKLARAADDAELQLARREKLRNERQDAQRYQSWSSRAADEAGQSEHGPL